MYQSLMTVRETQIAIKEVKTFFEDQLAKRLELFRVSAPLFVTKKSGLNDHLNGVERPIEFDMLHSGEELEIVHSLAKWKRFALHEYGYEAGEGLYTNMTRSVVMKNLMQHILFTLTNGIGKKSFKKNGVL